MSKFVKKELKCNKYTFYCNLAINSKSKRIKKKACNIVEYQIDNYFYHYSAL